MPSSQSPNNDNKLRKHNIFDTLSFRGNKHNNQSSLSSFSSFINGNNNKSDSKCQLLNDNDNENMLFDVNHIDLSNTNFSSFDIIDRPSDFDDYLDDSTITLKNVNSNHLEQPFVIVQFNKNNNVN